MTRIYAFANQKGGVGKTTTAVTLAHGFAMSGQRTLLVDLDPQGHVAFALGAEKSPGLYRLIVDEEPIEKVAIPARDNLDIIPGDKRTEKAKRTVVISNFPTEILARLFKHAEYDVIILYMAPSLDVLHLPALTVPFAWVQVHVSAVQPYLEIPTAGHLYQRDLPRWLPTPWSALR